ncbi:hypothetical protein HPB48_008577 [Haemaphysalis longicornis]|uniref:Uncharacterized protein n=1 Tax=Haemaphysalis longicornis TaxID=44386 RepID=A0A9J6GQN9_HAELO|nr:hypothetical protein HPB48_008577 [Haemaphysalis longicornis]
MIGPATQQKIDVCGIDPFLLDARDCVFNADLWPHITVMDIHDFLVLRTRFITSKQLKDYKALEAHNYVTSGWVKEPGVKQVGQDEVIVVTQCGMRIRAENSCTDGENSWLPVHIKKLQVRPVAEMDFASAAMKKRRLDDLGPSCSPQVLPRAPAPARAPAPPVSKQEKDEFLGKLFSSGLRPAAASTNSKFSELTVHPRD